MTDKTTPSAAPDNNIDRELETELTLLQQQWQGRPPAQPPEALDMAVLRQARSALSEATSSPPPRPWPWTRKWTHNLATAAVAVVAVTLLLQLREQAPAPPPDLEPAAGQILEKAAEPAAARAEAQMLEEAARPALRMSAPPAPARPMQGNTTEADSMTIASEERELLPAGEWLAQIEALYASGEREMAQQELAAFRARYPDFELPAYLASQ